MDRFYDGEAQKKQGKPMPNRRPARNGQNHFPPPSAVPAYASRNLPPLPPKSASSSSSVYNSEGSCRATPSRFHRHESPRFLHSGSGKRGSDADHEFGGSINEDGMAMIKPPGMSIVTRFDERSGGDEQQQEAVIHSPRPRHPEHKLVKDLELHDGFVDISPIMSPPTGTFSYKDHEVSPLTPDSSSLKDGFGEASVSDGGGNETGLPYWTVDDTDPGSRRQSRWEDIPPAASHSSLGFHPISMGEKTRIKSTSKTPYKQPHFRHSDPGSPTVDVSSSTGDPKPRAFMLAPKRYLKTPARPAEQVPRPRSENSHTKAPTKTRAASEDMIASPGPYSHWTKGYGATARSPSPLKPSSPSPVASGSSSRVSFAVKETPSFSKRTRAGSKPKPVPLHLREGGGKTADEHVKTPFPPDLSRAGPSQSSWDYDDDEVARLKPKRMSWGRTSDWSAAHHHHHKADGHGKSRTMGKLVSRVKHAGEDVMSKFSFTSEEAKREKRIEELRGKIHHHQPPNEQRTMF